MTATLLLLLLPAGGPIAVTPPGRAVTYEADVKPIVAAKCVVCHAGKDPDGGYDMATYAGVVKGGRRGAKVVVPGKAAESFLWTSSSHRAKPVMPPKSEANPLTPAEVGVLKAWIDAGATGPAAEAKAKRVVALKPPHATVTPVLALAFSPDGQTLAVGRGNRLLLYGPDGEFRREFTDPELVVPAASVSLVESAVFSPDGRTLAVGGFGEVALWDVKSAKPSRRLTGFADRVPATDFSPDGKLLAAGGGAAAADGELRLYDAASGELVADVTPSHSDTVYGVAFSPDGRHLATGGADRFVKVFAVPSGRLVKSFEGHSGHVLDVGWSRAGDRVVSAGADGLLKVWDFARGEKLREFKNHTGQVTRLAFAPKSADFVSVSADGTARTWNAESGGSGRTYAGAGPLDAVAVGPGGKLVAVGGGSGVVRLYGSDGKLVKELAIPK